MCGTDPRHLFLYGDHLGSTVQVRDADGKGPLRLGYSPFGQAFLKHSDYNHWSPADGSASALEQLGNLMPYQYTGRYTEATTGLVHLDARWYNPPNPTVRTTGSVELPKHRSADGGAS